MAEWVPLGDRAIRFPRPPGSSAEALLAAVRAWPGVVDVVVTIEDVAAYFDSAPQVSAGAMDRVEHLSPSATTDRLIELPAIYDGPDLASAAAHCGVTIDQLITLHRSVTYEVAMVGFAPGFAYLTGLDSRLQIPRRATPRPRVAGGSIGIAGGFTGVYPFDSPGGWHLVGRVVGVRLFDDTGARLRVGDRVRFVP